MPLTLIRGDSINVLPHLQGFDAIVTDPPYGLEFMGKEWDGANGFRRSLNEADAGRDSVFGRTSQRAPEYRTNASITNATSEREGRMRTYQDWCEAWARAAFRCLRPGAHLVAFGGTRTYHRLTCAIEDAGFEIRDTLMWLYGTGFPKSLNVERAVAMTVCTLPGRHYMTTLPAAEKARPGDHICPSTQDSSRWEGFGTALKPAWEPILLARRPIEGNVGGSVLSFGTGALNIGGCRVEGIKDTPASPRRAEQNAAYGDLSNDPGTGSGWDPLVGRFPANLIHDGSPEVLAAFAAWGEKTSGQPGVRRKAHETNSMSGRLGLTGKVETGHPGTGTAARFFPCCPWSSDDMRFYYSAKATKAERVGSRHPTVKPIALMRWLCRLVTPPGGHILDPFAGTGTTGAAAHAEGFSATMIEREAEYVEDIVRRCRRLEAAA